MSLSWLQRFLRLQSVDGGSAGRAEAAGALGRAVHTANGEILRLEPREDGLRDPLAMDDCQWRRAAVLHRHTPLLGVVWIDRSWRIHDDEVGFYARSRPRANLRLDSGRELRLEAERDEGLFTRPKDQ